MKLLVLSVTLVLVFLGANGSCPRGWASYESSCYLYFHERYTFFEAKVTCDIAQAMLVEIGDLAENSFVQNMAHNASGGRMWMGMEDFIVEGEFQWAGSHQTPEYYNWMQGDPSSYHDNEDCVVMDTPRGTWLDINCEDKYTFICEAEGNEEGLIGR